MEMIRRLCPICGNDERSRVFIEANYDLGRLGHFAFASRKTPEFMNFRLMECGRCDVVYADPAPPPGFFESSYVDAGFDASAESGFAARTYGRLVDRLVGGLPARGGALDVGTGDGAFLTELIRRGFQDVRGVEPSRAPAESAPPGVRERIVQRPFRPDEFDADSLRLFTCFQSLEHVTDPLDLVRGARRLLVDGGAALFVCHDRRAPLNRLLGRRSPIIDVEHLQLFSPKSAANLLAAAGFADVRAQRIVNRYPLRYWTRLVPAPAPIKRAMLSTLAATRLGGVPLSFPVGNLAVVGFKRAQG
jgi:SAM-dependent methyltransferase